MLTANFIDYDNFKSAIKQVNAPKVLMLKVVPTTPFSCAALISSDGNLLVVFRLFLSEEPDKFNKDFQNAIAVNSVGV